MTADTHVVREGETLTSIAARIYGDPTLWVNLANENDIRDPRSIVAGQLIRILPA